MIIQPNDIQYLGTVFIGAISGSLALGGTLISQLWGKDDTSSPSIYLTDPPNGKDNVPINTRITATFDRLMNESTINKDTFTLKENEKGDNEKAEKVHLEGGNAILQPAAPLKPSTVYLATITQDVKDVSGNSLAKNYTWSFKTGS
jgi:Bacterial Ig-like domain